MARQETDARRRVWSWAFYDFANSPFTTLVVTFVYATYFTQVVAPDPVRGTALWSGAVTVTALVVALAAPPLGALADRSGTAKHFLLAFTAVAVAATAALYPVLPGEVALALAVFVVANVCFELALVMYNALLPAIAPADRIGRISGYGWGLGYIGGLIALTIALVTLVQPETPWFGFSRESGENIRATNLLVAVWYVVFSLPLILWVRAAPAPADRSGSIVSATAGRLAATFRQIRTHRQIVRFLLARLIYNDGLVTVFAFGGIYAAGTFAFSLEEILLFGIVLNLTAGLGAFLMGHLDDRIGGKRTIQVSLVGLSIAAVVALAAPTKPWLWAAGIVVGTFAGPNQAASRSLMSRFVPTGKENEFFGFFAFSGKATAFLGPLLFGLLTEAFGTQRAGVAVVLIFLVLGAAVLAGVDEEEGIRTAGRA